ncbi:methyl-accepting chemotaxis protein [Arenibacterium sp. LLYu02]|uniref:methyl-accepting chemotaxis protein n=1 Tax=Arenibacterium sp. LLYu02 TaxID=3404132 RepID=UPI003B213C96
MFFSKRPKTTSQMSDAEMLIKMIDRTQAVIEFEPDGTIIRANENFLRTLGYSLEEIVGQHHRIFVYKGFSKTERYAQMWRDLADGKFLADQFPRVCKDGSVVWIQATYAPLVDEHGVVIRVVKIATEITARRNELLSIAKALEELRDGNLTHRCAPSDLEDVQRLVASYNEAVDALQQAIRTAGTVAQRVKGTATDLQAASLELSHRTESQAATLEQTAAAVEELTATVRSAADGARDVEVSVADARDAAEQSGGVMREAVKAMSQIESSSAEISKIISVIDDIAFQTNLLALNAGVEAARAGEAGRGFAVVASEVRGLALRSAEAAGEIKSLIRKSSEYVSNGARLVDRSGAELEMIITSINSIASNVSEIARGAQEQATTLAEINSGVSQLDEVTQSNTAMVERTTLVGSNLATDAVAISHEIDRFKVDEAIPDESMQTWAAE